MRKTALLVVALAGVALILSCARPHVTIAPDPVYTGSALPVFLDPVLAQHVDSKGLVDYTSLASDPRWDDILRFIAGTRADALLTREEQLAYWINTYNVLVVKAALDHQPITYFDKNWYKNLKFRAGGQDVTLDQIENTILRARFKGEPRIHFALACGAISCPPLRPEAYRAELLDEQLDHQGRRFLQESPRRNHLADGSRTLHLSALFNWYAADFGSTANLTQFLMPYFSDEDQAFIRSTAMAAAPAAAPAGESGAAPAPAGGGASSVAQTGFDLKVEFLPFDYTLASARDRVARERLLPYGEVWWSRTAYVK